MRTILHLFAFCATAWVLSACKPASTPAPASASAVDMIPSKDPSVTASYACDGGHRVDIVGERNARITLSDGQLVTIDYVDNSRPRSFMGRGLRFAIGDKAIMLIQNDGVAVHCKPIE